MERGCREQHSCATCVASTSALLSMQCKWCPISKLCSSPSELSVACGDVSHPSWMTAGCAAPPSSLIAPSIVQPELSPAVWFLTADEILMARGGAPRSEAVYTSGNTATLLPSGKAVFDAFADGLQALGNGSSVYISGWDIAPSMPLSPERPDVTVTSALDAAQQRGAVTRGLAWYNVDRFKVLFSLTEQVKAYNELPSTAATGSSIHLDTRSPRPTGSIHQKFFWMRDEGGLEHAVVGGVDLTWARWDTETRTAAEQAARTKHMMGPDGPGPGRVDRAVSLAGPAASDVGNVFAGRWNDPDPPKPENAARTKEWQSESHKVPLSTPSSQPAKGPHHVQVLLTASCGYWCVHCATQQEYPWAPLGDSSIHALILKGFRTAKAHVYIEDQYANLVTDYRTEIERALMRGVRFVVLTNDAENTNVKACTASQYAMWAALRTAYPSLLSIFTPTKLQPSDVAPIYVHSKTYIFDDVLYVTGSANMNNRSSYHDTELNAGVIDDTHTQTPDGITVATFAHEARLDQWAALTRTPSKALRNMTFAQGAALIGGESTITRRLELPASNDGAVNMAICSALDPGSTCH